MVIQTKTIDKNRLMGGFDNAIFFFKAIPGSNNYERITKHEAAGYLTGAMYYREYVDDANNHTFAFETWNNHFIMFY